MKRLNFFKLSREPRVTVLFGSDRRNLNNIFVASHSRRLSVHIICLMCLGFDYSASLYAQQAATAAAPVPRDPAALGILVQAVHALGGQTAFNGISDLVATGSCQSVRPGQPAVTSQVRWTQSGNEYLYESIINGPQSAMGSGHGQAWSADSSGKVTAISAHSAAMVRPFYAPGLMLLRILQDNSVSIQSLGSVQLNGRQLIDIETVDTALGAPLPETKEDWFIDPVSNLVVRYQHQVVSEATMRVAFTNIVDYGPAQLFGQLLWPSSVTSSSEGRSRTRTCQIFSITLNSTPDPSVFDRLVGGGQ